MKIKVSTATGPALDWMVAKAEGFEWKPVQRPTECFRCVHYEERQGRDDPIQYCHHPKMEFNDGSTADCWEQYDKRHPQCPYNTEVQEPVYPAYSTDWAQGGPIIEREWLDVTPWPNESEESKRWDCVQHDCNPPYQQFGPTPLIAAMRCYVASKLGEEVDVPEELT